MICLRFWRRSLWQQGISIAFRPFCRMGQPTVRHLSFSSGGIVNFSILDIGLSVLMLLFLVRGLLRGLISEVAGFIGILLGLFLAGSFYPQLSPQFAGIVESARLAAGLSYAVIFVATLIVVALCAAVIRRFMALTLTSWLDNLLGAVVGAVKGILICAIALALVQRLAPDSPFLKNSLISGYIEAVVVFARSLTPAFLDAAFAG
jgi:membrane protein required for colicin V production